MRGKVSGAAGISSYSRIVALILQLDTRLEEENPSQPLAPPRIHESEERLRRKGNADLDLRRRHQFRSWKRNNKYPAHDTFSIFTFVWLSSPHPIPQIPPPLQAGALEDKN